MSQKDQNEKIGRGKRIGLIVGVFVVVMLGIAWFQGGEEPLRPIVQPIDTPDLGPSSEPTPSQGAGQ